MKCIMNGIKAIGHFSLVIGYHVVGSNYEMTRPLYNNPAAKK